MNYTQVKILIHCSNNKLNKLILIDDSHDIRELRRGVKVINCYNNRLTKLILNSVCKVVYCQNNQLKELIITDSCRWIKCHNNQLEKLFIPAGCVEVWADMKSVTVLNKVEDLNLWI